MGDRAPGHLGRERAAPARRVRQRQAAIRAATRTTTGIAASTTTTRRRGPGYSDDQDDPWCR
jgi:hypothetical protein